MLKSNYYCNLGQHISDYRSDSFSEMMMMMLWIEQYETGWAGMGGNTFLDQNLESVQWWVTVSQAEIQLTMWLVNTGRDSITTQANTSDLHCIITWTRGEIIVIWLYDVDGSTRGMRRVSCQEKLLNWFHLQLVFTRVKIHDTRTGSMIIYIV